MLITVRPLLLLQRAPIQTTITLSNLSVRSQLHLKQPAAKLPSAADSTNALQRLCLRAFATALSVAILASPSLLLLRVEAAVAETPALTQLPTEICREEEREESVSVEPERVTNEGLVEEAWEVVNDSFLGLGDWSREKWLQKKEDILNKNFKTRSKAHELIKKMLASLGDPYTRFLSPSERRMLITLATDRYMFSKMARYDMTGIGINLREIPEDDGSVKLKVLGIILDGPAHSAGVRQGDELLSVNSVDVRGKSAFEASSLLLGPKETFVNIEVKHGNCGPVESLRIQRQVVARTPISYRLEKLDKGNISVGYIHIKEFNALAKKDLVTALKRLQDYDVSYFILDLRDNLGGLVQAGIEVAKLFLDSGQTVTYTVGKDPEIQKSIVAESAPMVTSPLIVLMNKRTASASEIVATALHDNCKAVLVGDRTFGKGLIQSVFELHDGSGLVVTIGKYVTPNHKDINGDGVQPDFQRMPDLNDITSYLSQCQRVG